MIKHPLSNFRLKRSAFAFSSSAEQRVFPRLLARAALHGSVLLIALSLAAPFSFAQEKKGAVAPKAAAPATQAAKPAINPITEAATKAGVKTCTDRINQVSNFLTANTQSGWLLMMSKAQPDKLMVSASMEVATKEVPFPAYVSESFAPNQANGCSGIYETVVFWEEGCQAVAKKQFTTLKATGVLSKTITVLDGGSNLKVFLMPAGKGCVAIKKEVMQ